MKYETRIRVDEEKLSDGSKVYGVSIAKYLDGRIDGLVKFDCESEKEAIALKEKLYSTLSSHTIQKRQGLFA